MLLRNVFLSSLMFTLMPYAVGQDTWEPLNVGTSVQTITTSDGDIFVSSYGSGGGVLRSTDDGESWVPAINGMPSNLVRAVGRSGDVLLAGHNTGIFRSTDGGDTWLATTGIPGTVSGGAREFYTFSGVTLAVFAGEIQNGGGIYRSVDNGATWSAAYAGLSSNMTIHHLAVHNNVIYVATSVGIFRSTNNAASWETLGANVDNYTTFAIQFFGERLVAVTTFGVLRSDDLGQNWSTPATGLFPDVIVVPPNPPPTPTRGELIAYDGKLFLSTGYNSGSSKLYRSIDGGLTFSVFDNGISEIDQSNQNQFFASSEGLFVGALTDAYRIDGSTVVLNEVVDQYENVISPTVFTDGFAIDLPQTDLRHTLVVRDLAGRLILKKADLVPGKYWIDRGTMRSGTYNCVLIDHIGQSRFLGTVIAQ